MKIDIINRIDCAPDEISRLKEYLQKTQVNWVVKCIDNGARVSKGEIQGLSALGNLKTFWSDLGDVSSIKEHGSEKFSVNQVMDALSKPQNMDNANAKKALSKINEYSRRLASGQLELIITLIETNNGLMIIDGNSRAVTYFEHYKEIEESGCLPVFIIAY